MGATGVPLSQWCDQAAWYNPLAYAVCLPHDLSKVLGVDLPGSGNPNFPAPPQPLAPTTTLVPNGGVDVLGNPTYDVVPQTAQEQHASIVQQMQDFFTSVDQQNNPPKPPPDCTGTFSMFSSACNSYAPLAWVGAGLAGLYLFKTFFGGRR